jgi:hypothetical protein
MQHFSQSINYNHILIGMTNGKERLIVKQASAYIVLRNQRHIPFFLLLHLFSDHTLEEFSTDVCWLFTNNEVVFIYDTAVVNLDHFSLLMLKLE